MLTYEKAGVSIEKGNQLVQAIGAMTKGMRKVRGGGSVGGFAAVADFPKGYKHPQMVLATDGVGTKILICKEVGKYDTVGIDLVAMSVNDILTMGAEPYLFLDYYATSKLDLKVSKDIIKGIVKGCNQSNVALVGGETAEMPGVYTPGDFDLAGFCVGVLEKGQSVTGANVKAGDVVIGLPSNGVHSNGYSLVRKVLASNKIQFSDMFATSKQTWGQILLKPTKIYVEEVMPLIQNKEVKAMAHITGGGLPENLVRVLPDGMAAHIDAKTWSVPKVFTELQRLGDIPKQDMYKTFNMGIGFVLVVSAKKAKKILSGLKGAKVIGQVHPSKQRRPEVVISD
ncbi:MAG: phosphoribosylformylglycinamidine cyclo-ligase [Bdellovibrionota bacterium]